MAECNRCGAPCATEHRYYVMIGSGDGMPPAMARNGVYCSAGCLVHDVMENHAYVPVEAEF